MSEHALDQDPIIASFKALGIEPPTDPHICLYRAQLIDSFGVMQLVLQIEVESGIRIDLVSLMNEGVSLERMRKLLSE